MMQRKHIFSVCMLALLLSGCETSSVRMINRYDGSIEKYISPYDQDQDGMDDQTDILESALAYVNTHPQYKSAYYAGGYPDDSYGVCTDVVAFALKNAGYDLMSLVDADVRAYPKEYDIEQPDSNIDFRRVKNLRVYFSRHALSLTIDPEEIEEWQGGDIVIFENHIGIVSDRRNREGITYVIHHSSPAQMQYEQDILEKRDDIVGHYRWSAELL